MAELKLDDEITVIIKGKLRWAEGFKKGFMAMKFADTSVTVSESINGKVIGHVEGTLGGGLDIRTEKGGERWHFSAEDFWNAFIEAREKLEIKDA